MFLERRIGPDGQVELWQCRWENQAGAAPRKISVGKVGVEEPVQVASAGGASEVPAICWAYGRTLGNIAVHSPSMLGSFPAKAGDDATLPCDFVDAGKFRNGAERWWCRTHQTHWGTKGDLESLTTFGAMRCSNNEQRMCYVVQPFEIDLDSFADNSEVGVWCSMPAALSTVAIRPRAPRIHVHVRPQVGQPKTVDRDFHALSVLYSQKLELFSTDITRVNITPPAAFEFVSALEEKREMSCVNCSHCRYPHLDLGDFARKPHRKHFCGNCGRDSTWSEGAIVSTPLFLLHQRLAKTLRYETPTRELDLDQYSRCSYTIWASTPAIIWSATRPQEFGIHVHVHDGATRIIDDTFGKVTLNGADLDRASLVTSMIQRSVV